MEQELIDLSSQARALAESRGLSYEDLQGEFQDDEIIEAFGGQAPVPAVPAAVPAVPAAVPAVPAAVPAAPAAPAAVPAVPAAVPAAPAAVPAAPAAVPAAPAAVPAAVEREDLSEQARRILEEQRPDLNYDALRQQNFSDDEIIEAFRPGPTVAASRALQDARLVEDFDALRRLGLDAGAIARYAAERTQTATGMTYEDYVARRLSDDDIIGLLFDNESVAQLRNPMLSAAGRYATRNVPVAAGVYGGAKIGAAVGGPYAPITALLGAVIGGVSSTGAGEEIEAATFGPEVPVVPGQELAYRFGRFTGETIPFMVLPHVAATRYTTPELALLQWRAQQGSQVAALNPRVTPWDSYMLGAAFRPRSVVAAETTGTALGATAAATVQQSYFPGEPESIVPDLFGAGVGAVAPVRAINGAIADLTVGAFRTIANVASGAETRSANVLSDIVMQMYRESGQDPQATIDRLMETPLEDLAGQFGVDIGTVGTLVRAGDDPVMRDIFASLQQVSSGLGPTNARARQAQLLKNLAGVVQLSRVMANTGDPQLVQEAARIQEEAFSAGLQLNYDAHLASASDTARKILESNPLARQEASAVVAQAVEDSVASARRQRDRLYNLVDDATPSPNGFRNFASRANEIIARTEEVRHIDAFRPKAEALQRTLDDLAADVEAGEEITVGRMRRIRSTMLNNMRQAGAGQNKDPVAQRYWGQLAESVFDDLMFRADEAFAGTDPTILNMLSANDRALLEANQFNVAFYDVFGRAFPEEVLRDTMAGGRRIPVELITERLFQGSGDATDIRLRQLDDAATFVASRFPEAESAGAAENRLHTLRSAQDRVLRIMASRTVDLSDPQNPRVDTNRLRQLMRADNPNGFGPALERFEGLRQDLNNAVTAENLLLGAIDENAASVAARESQEWLTTLLRVDAGEAMREAVGSPGARPYVRDRGGYTGAADLGRMVTLAKNSENPDLALRGVVDTALDRALTYAGGGSGEINFSAFREFLTQSLGGKTDSILGVLRKEGAINAEQDANIRTLLREAEIIERASRNAAPDPDATAALKTVSPINLILVGRFLGAREGARLQRMANLQTLLIPQQFANIGAQIAARVPASRKLDLFNRFMNEPEFARLILDRGIARSGSGTTRMSPNREMQNMTRTLNSFQNYLTRAGLMSSAPLITGEAGRLDFSQTLPGAAQAATPDLAELEAYIQSAQPPAPVPATPAAAPRSTPATPSAGAPPPAAPAGPPPAPRAGGQGASYSALFPNDPIAPLMQQREMQQGIGSLVGPR